MAKIIGLTGGIGCGKSSVSAYLHSKNLLIIDADQIAREVVALGTRGLELVVEAFGAEILCSDGSLNRGRLGAIVFGDPHKLACLNAITHPLIEAAIHQRLVETASEALVVLDVPLLLESGQQHLVDEIWVVAVDSVTQLARIMARDGLGEAEALARMATQMPTAEKCRYAHHIIDNNGSLAATYAQVDRLLAQVSNKAQI